MKGACPSIQEVDRYNIAYRNGFFKAGLHGGWFIKGYKKKNHALTRNASVSFSDFPLLDFSKRYWGEAVPALDNKLAHPRRDDPFWRSREAGSGADYRRAFLDSTMPILLRTAFYDIYTEGLNDMWRETPFARRANCALLIDTYDHGGKLKKEMKGTRGEFPDGTRHDEGIASVDWFDYCRTGRPCPKAAPGRVRYYALWENRWIEDDGLKDGAKRIDMPLGTGTRAWTCDPKRPLPVFPGSGGICFGGMRLQPPPDFRDDVVSYVLLPVTETIDVRGRMCARLTVTSGNSQFAPHGNVKGLQAAVREPKVAHNAIRTDASFLTLFH